MCNHPIVIIQSNPIQAGQSYSLQKRPGRNVIVNCVRMVHYYYSKKYVVLIKHTLLNKRQTFDTGISDSSSAYIYVNNLRCYEQTFKSLLAKKLSSLMGLFQIIFACIKLKNGQNFC